MAKYSLTYSSVTATAIADTTALTDGNYQFALQGGSSTMQLRLNELTVIGEASASSTLGIFKLARDSTVMVTPSAGAVRNALKDASATAPGTIALFGNSASTDPQRSATLHLMHVGLNLYGGIFKWQASPEEQFTVVGNTASLGEVSLSGFTGTGAAASSGTLSYELV